jgi:hypothetical protein
MGEEKPLSALSIKLKQDAINLKRIFDNLSVVVTRVMAEANRTAGIISERQDDQLVKRFGSVSITDIVKKMENCRRLGSFDELKIHEMNAVIHEWQDVDSDLLNALLVFRKGLENKLWKSLARSWSPDLFDRMRKLFVTVRLQPGRYAWMNQEIASSLSIEKFVRKYFILNLDETKEALRKDGLKSSYRFTFSVLVALCISKVVEVKNSGEIYRVFCDHVLFEKFVWWRRAGDSDISVDDRAQSVAALVEIASLKSFHAVDFVLADLKRISDMAGWGDPRRWRGSLAWQRVREKHVEHFQKYIIHLNAENIEFFFNSKELGINSERRDFWMGYKSRFVETHIILRKDTYAELLEKYSQDEEILRKVRSAYSYSSGAAKAQHSLILVFDEVVCVENSASNRDASGERLVSGTYITTGEGFRLIFERFLASPEIAGRPGTSLLRLKDYNDLRARIKKANSDTGVNQTVDRNGGFLWTHSVNVWPKQFAEKLSSWGVQPDKYNPYNL